MCPSRLTRWRLAPVRIAAPICSALLALGALAQGGPPMVTDDPQTPGDGHWEVNLGNIGSRTPEGWLIEVLDADINYGWGDRTQLRFETPWNAAQQGSHWTNGLGTTLLGVKWRFLGDEPTGWTGSIYPQLGINLNPGSAMRGLANPGKSLLLPVESATHLGPIDLDVELGRSLAQQGPAEWVAGLILAHSFAPGLECMLETRARVSRESTETLVNLGSRWEISKGLTLLGAAGREIGAPSAGRVNVLYYLGIELVR
jgi:hypothetical protein